MNENQARRLARLLELITSDHPGKRLEGWVALQHGVFEFHGTLAIEQRMHLLRAWQGESVSEVWNAALHTLVALGALGGVAAASLSHPALGGPASVATPLAAWLWTPFQNKSAVCSVTAACYRRRDEYAVLHLRGRLSRQAFPNTEFPQISLEKPDVARRIFRHKFRSICLVGRPGLFGPETLERLSVAGLRFYFELDRRPEGLAQNALDSRYHCICERNGSAEPVRHISKSVNGQRQDYGLVQRYTVSFGTVQLVVVICAGASSLGTLGACEWVAEDLFHPTHPALREAIDLPETTGANSRLEVLLRVSAKESELLWENPQVEFEKLYLDDKPWSPALPTWPTRGPALITIVTRQGQTKLIRFDGEIPKLQIGRQPWRLTAALARQVLSTKRPELDIAALAADDEIWDHPGPNQEYVHDALTMLKCRHLRQALSLSGVPRLEAEVQEEVE